MDTAIKVLKSSRAISSANVDLKTYVSEFCSGLIARKDFSTFVGGESSYITVIRLCVP
jgi:hypothetical protein